MYVSHAFCHFHRALQFPGVIKAQAKKITSEEKTIILIYTIMHCVIPLLNH